MPCQKNASSLFLIYSLHDKISINSSDWYMLPIINYRIKNRGRLILVLTLFFQL